MKTTPNRFQKLAADDHKNNQKFSIDPEAFEGIMDILSGMYPEILVAVLREYATNGKDANKESGTTKPLEIRIDNEDFIALDGTRKSYGIFEVKDCGPGMNFDDVVNTYIRYGTTTKKERNDFAGGFGIGSKSAFALTKYFEIIAVKDGRKLGFGFTREEEEGAFYDVFIDEETNEENGVTVRIPLSGDDVRNMLKVAKLMFITWDVGSYTINGQIPEENIALHDENQFLTVYDMTGKPLAWVSMNSHIEPKTRHQETTAERKKYYYSAKKELFKTSLGKEQTYIGGSPYRSPVKQSAKYGNETDPYVSFFRGHSIVWNLPIGSVKVTPDRTAIKDTRENKAKIEAFHEQVWASIPDIALEYVSKLSTKEAARWVACNQAIFLRQDFNTLVINDVFYSDEYKLETIFPGVPVKEIFKGKTGELLNNRKTFRRSSVYSGISAWMERKHYTGKTINVMLWGTPNAGTTTSYRDVLPAVRGTLERYVDSEDIFCVHLETDKDPTGFYTDGWVVINVNDLADLRKTFNAKVSKFRTPTPKPEEVIHGAEPGEAMKALDPETVENAKKLVYVQESQISTSREWLKDFTAQEKSRRYHSFSARLIKSVLSDYTIVFLPNNRSPKSILKLNPDAIDFYTAVQEKIDSHDPEFFSIAKFVSDNWKIRSTDFLPKHSLIAEAITEIKNPISHLRGLANLIDIIPVVKETEQLPVAVPPKTRLVEVASEIMHHMTTMNVRYFNKLMELYPEVAE